MEHFTKDDLAQLDLPYLQSLDKDRMITVAYQLRNLCVTLVERIDQNSSISSKPPSSDSPYDKGGKGNSDTENDDTKSSSTEDKENKTTENSSSTEDSESNDSNRTAGRQPGSQGFGRSETPVPESTIPHHPTTCAICKNDIDIAEGSWPYMGYYVYELEKTAVVHTRVVSVLPGNNTGRPAGWCK